MPIFPPKNWTSVPNVSYETGRETNAHRYSRKHDGHVVDFSPHALIDSLFQQVNVRFEYVLRKRVCFEFVTKVADGIWGYRVEFVQPDINKRWVWISIVRGGAPVSWGASYEIGSTWSVLA